MAANKPNRKAAVRWSYLRSSAKHPAIGKANLADCMVALKASQRAALAELDGLFDPLQYRVFRGDLIIL